VQFLRNFNQSSKYFILFCVELKAKIGPTDPPMIPAQNLSREEKLEQLLQMSEGIL
jgi:hypothetical protein